jgi:hypothetical protein
MASGPMNTTVIELALQRLGETFIYHADVELLLVGGAAGMVTGVLPPSRTTTDCDVMVCAPARAMEAVERAAEVVAAEMGLSERWLNSDVQIRLDALPDGWESRRVLAGSWGRLRVWAASRVDLIAMKVLAGRAQDLEDLRVLRVRQDDVVFVRRYLDAVGLKGAAAEQIADAVELLTSLKIHDHE